MHEELLLSWLRSRNVPYLPYISYILRIKESGMNTNTYWL